jgi:type I restriction enzyme S subunit
MSEWKEKSLIELADIIPGFAFKSKDFGQIGETVIKIKDIQPPLIDLSSTEKVNTSNYDKKKLKKYLLEYGDFVIAMTGATIGKVGRLKEEKPALINQRVAKIKAKQGVNNDFVYYSVTSIDFQAFIQNNIDSHSAQENISGNSIGRFPILTPPLPEQTAIAFILSSLDDKINLLHRQNANLEKMAETLFRQWFLEEANEDWEEGILGEVIEIFDNLRIPLSKMEREKKKEGQLYPYYGAAQIMDYINDYIFDGEYILLGEDGTVRTDEGYPVLQYATGKFWVNNHTHVITAKHPYNNFFIWNYLKKKNIDEIVTGAVQPKINQANLKSIDFPKYPENLVLDFNVITKPLLKKINHNTTQIRTLTALRDTLLPKLMSGEVRVENNKY